MEKMIEIRYQTEIPIARATGQVVCRVKYYFYLYAFSYVTLCLSLYPSLRPFSPQLVSSLCVLFVCLSSLGLFATPHKLFKLDTKTESHTQPTKNKHCVATE